MITYGEVVLKETGKVIHRTELRNEAEATSWQIMWMLHEELTLQHHDSEKKLKVF